MDYYIGIDLGGTNIVAGLFDAELNLLQKTKKPTQAALGSDYVLGTIASMAKELISHEGTHVVGLGVGVPGLIDPVHGVSLFAGNLNWRDLPVAERLETLTGIPTYVDNDVRMYTYGEAIAGAGRGYEVVFGIILGTGIAAGLIDHGRPYYGGGFMAGEFGHIRMEGEHALCGCGMTGCLETVASATGIARIMREQIECGERSIISEWVQSTREIDAYLVSKAYDAGDILAVDIMNYVGRMLGKGLSYAIPLISPDVVVIGGGAANAGERLLRPMREELERRTLPMYMERIKFKLAEHLDDAGLIGNAANARSRAQK